MGTTDLARELPHEPCAEDFRALARSSPWRFTTLHWTHGSQGPDGGRVEVEAWLRRPWELTVRVLGTGGAPDAVSHVQGPPYATTAWDHRPMVAPQQVEPVRRPDGLVLERPSGEVDYDDPMHGNFVWVAMLDPVELADGEEPGLDGVDVTEVHAADRHGRATWWATCRPTPGYAARCAGCCDLLPTRLTQELEADRSGYRPPEEELASLPTAYLVGLDVQTGVVVDVTPLDGQGGTRLTNVIHQVDGPLSPPAAP